MKNLQSLTTDELVRRAWMTAIGLMLIWVFSITLSIFTSMKVLAELWIF